MAHGAGAVLRFGQGDPPPLEDAGVFGQKVGLEGRGLLLAGDRHLGPLGLTFLDPDLDRLDLVASRGLDRLEGGFLRLDPGLAVLDLLHGFEDQVFARTDLAFDVFDLVEERRVFLVGLDLAELALVLRPPGFEILNLELKALAILGEAIERRLGGLESRAIRHDLRLDRGLLPGQSHQLTVEAPQLHIGVVKVHERLKIRMHSRPRSYLPGGSVYSTQISIVSPSSPTIETISRILRVRSRFQKPSAS